MADNNGWDQYKVHVLSEIKDLKDMQRAQSKDLTDIKTSLSSMKTTQRWETRIASAVWGVIILAINFFIGKHN